MGIVKYSSAYSKTASWIIIGKLAWYIFFFISGYKFLKEMLANL